MEGEAEKRLTFDMKSDLLELISIFEESSYTHISMRINTRNRKALIDIGGLRHPIVGRSDLVVTPQKHLVISFHAVQTLLTASVKPTSLVSNSYNPKATVKVAARRPHQNNDRILGSRLTGT